MKFEDRYRPTEELEGPMPTMVVRQCLTCGVPILHTDNQLEVHHEWHEAQERLLTVVRELNPGASL